MAEKKSVHSDHRKRVRARVIKSGFSQLEKHELLELLLFYSIPVKDTNELAHNILEHFDNSLEEVFNASVEQLQKVTGVGERTAIMIAAIGATLRKINENPEPKKRVYKNTEALKNVAVSLLKGKTTEEVVLLCFDETKKLKRSVTISSGDKVSSEIDMKLIIKNLVDTDSSIAVLAHNHPTSSAEPSAYDVDSTRMVCVTLRKVGYALADHIIVGENGEAYSMHLDPRFSALFY